MDAGARVSRFPRGVRHGTAFEVPAAVAGRD